MADELADRRLWFTADESELVEEGDPDAAFLAAIPGRPLPDAPVRTRPEPKQQAPAVKADAEPAADKGSTNKPKRTSSRKRQGARWQLHRLGGVNDGD